MYYDEEEFDQEIMIDKLLNETIYKNKKMIIKDLYFGAKIREKSIDGMTFCHEIDKWVNTEEYIKQYYEEIHT